MTISPVLGKGLRFQAIFAGGIMPAMSDVTMILKSIEQGDAQAPTAQARPTWLCGSTNLTGKASWQLEKTCCQLGR
jgi:hypothetical protein